MSELSNEQIIQRIVELKLERQTSETKLEIQKLQQILDSEKSK
jgi:hypothetical protein